jgi:hypothetical protein
VELKKQEILKLLQRYVDINNCIDISSFHKENPKEYSLLPHYFGSVNTAINENGWIKITKPQKGEKKLSLRDMLALDMLNLLRKGGKIEKSTLEEIGKKYNASRAGINQLHKALNNYSKDVDEKTENI